MEDNEDFQKLKALLFSPDKANVELAKTLAESQNIKEISDLYQQMESINRFWTEHPLDGYPKETSRMIDYFKRNGLSFFKNYTVREIPEEHSFLAPFINKFYIWYTSLHTLPKGLGMFYNIEKIVVVGGPLTHILEEVWRLPKLTEVDLTIGKNFKWDDNVLLAKNLKTLMVKGVVYPSLPEELPQMPNLKVLGYSALGDPKDAVQLPEILWDCIGIEDLSLFGKTILFPVGKNFEQLKKLKTLELRRINWDKLPDTLLDLPDLDELTLAILIKLKSLPEWFSKLPISSLYIYQCKFDNAFEIIKKMPNLKKLKLSESIQKKVKKEDWENEFKDLELSWF